MTKLEHAPTPEDNPTHVHRLAMLSRALRLRRFSKTLVFLGVVVAMFVVPAETGFPTGFSGTSAIRAFARNAPWVLQSIIAISIGILVLAAILKLWERRIAKQLSHT